MGAAASGIAGEAAGCAEAVGSVAANGITGEAAGAAEGKVQGREPELLLSLLLVVRLCPACCADALATKGQKQS